MNDRPASPVPSSVAAEVDLAREVAVYGRPLLARRLCGAVFLDHLPILMRDPALLEAYVGLLLLLEMSALLPRLLRAVFGVGFIMTRRHATGRNGVVRSGWSLSLRDGVELLMPAFSTGGAARDHARSALWARKIIDAAAEDGWVVYDQVAVAHQSPPAWARKADFG